MAVQDSKNISIIMGVIILTSFVSGVTMFSFLKKDATKKAEKLNLDLE